MISTNTRTFNKPNQLTFSLFSKQNIKNNRVIRNSKKYNCKDKYQTTIGRFNTNIENFHGRLAMLGIFGCSLNEIFEEQTIIQQFVNETGIPSYQIISFICFTTLIFLLEIINPITELRIEKELSVFTNPGFTIDTEVLHGRMAMLVFMYIITNEYIYNSIIFSV